MSYFEALVLGRSGYLENETIDAGVPGMNSSGLRLVCTRRDWDLD